MNIINKPTYTYIYIVLTPWHTWLYGYTFISIQCLDCYTLNVSAFKVRNNYHHFAIHDMPKVNYLVSLVV